MNLVATSSFRNHAPDKIKVEGAIHPLHIHKGARFSVGGNAPLEKLNADEKRIVVELNIAGRIVEESQAALVAKIDAEVEQERISAERKK